ncbi:IclR family transcriptional regulator [Mesorhizobium sp. B4-1-1]|uniref:IclR family transcriptional regulator n=1 Tax=Mesorhizobium sp. B4-1-1 TaxID=2589890 RepID=UPI00112E926F|nr:IclR family transcriptional regulator [Mesorhizobium sp. B4-1-1]TPI20603.1 IclR family transcriptional regulator [Mesorhizobium sp. B4-1-1]
MPTREQAEGDLAREPKSATGTLSTLARGLAILEFVVRAGRLVRLRDVAERFGLDRSAALRFLRTLEAEGYISRHEAMKAYSIGPKLLALPRLPAAVEKMIEFSRPCLIDLARASGQMTHLGTLNGTHAILVEVVASNAPVAVKQAVGDLEPLYSSAVGKAIYAFLPEAERIAIGAQINFVAHTARTITGLAALEREAQDIRRTGVSFDRGEGNDQVSCIGCPVLDANGYPRASIGISFVSAHLAQPVDQRREDIAKVAAAARKIESLLFA